MGIDELLGPVVCYFSLASRRPHERRVAEVGQSPPTPNRFTVNYPMFSETRFHHRLHLGEAEIFAREQECRLRDIPPLNTMRVLAERFDLFGRRLRVRVAVVTCSHCQLSL